MGTMTEEAWLSPETTKGGGDGISLQEKEMIPGSSNKPPLLQGELLLWKISG